MYLLIISHCLRTEDVLQRVRREGIVIGVIIRSSNALYCFSSRNADTVISMHHHHLCLSNSKQRQQQTWSGRNLIYYVHLLVRETWNYIFIDEKSKTLI